MKKLPNINCTFCFKEFHPRKSTTKYCCRHCQSKDLSKKKISGRRKRGEYFKCQNCNELFYIPQYRIKTGKAKYCSRKCLAAVHLKKYIPIYGFKKSQLPSKKYKCTQSFGRSTRLHRAVLENHLGRKLLTTEHVHHIDGNPDNNHISNLVILSNSDHGKISYVERQQISELSQPPV